MSQPKPDTKLLEALGRLRNNHDFQQLVKHQQAVFEFYKNTLIAVPPAEVPRFQGRAAELQDFLSLLSKGK